MLCQVVQRVQGELVRRTADHLHDGVGSLVRCLASRGHRVCQELCAQPDTPLTLRAR